MLDTAIGISLYLTAIAFVLHGIRARRLKRLAPFEPMNPMILTAGEIMRPILQLFAAYAAVKTTLMYYMLGGPKIFPLADFIGLPCVIAAYAIWIQLKMQQIPEPKRPAPAEPAPSPRLPPELMPRPITPLAVAKRRDLELVD